MQELGIRHGDMHEGTILVTAEDVVFLLDFGACDSDASDWALDAEQRELEWLSSLRQQVRYPPPSVLLSHQGGAEMPQCYGSSVTVPVHVNTCSCWLLRICVFTSSQATSVVRDSPSP